MGLVSVRAAWYPRLRWGSMQGPVGEGGSQCQEHLCGEPVHYAVGMGESGGTAGGQHGDEGGN